MAIQDINLGASANDGTGDNLRVAGGKINSNNADFQQQINNNKKEYRSAQAVISRTNQTTVALANQQANVFEEYFTDNFTPLTTDNFTLSVRWKWSSDNTQNSAFFRVTFSDGINPDIILLTTTEPKDASGGGEVVNVLESGAIVGNVNTGTSERLNGYEIADLVLTQGVTYNLKLEWASEIANADLTVYSSTIRWEQNTITQ